ncbi:MAG: putative metal-binding protein [Desulforhopalus sp.]|jgi:predicted metal-binding protein
MIKIAILIREETTRKCTGQGCLKSFNQRTESFARYQGAEVELVGFFHSGGDLDYKIQKMKDAGVDIIHVSTCMRAKYEGYEELVHSLGKDFDVIGYTHGSKEGKTRSTVSVTGKITLLSP